MQDTRAETGELELDLRGRKPPITSMVNRTWGRSRKQEREAGADRADSTRFDSCTESSKRARVGAIERAAVSQKAEVANANEAAGKQMEQEPP